MKMGMQLNEDQMAEKRPLFIHKKKTSNTTGGRQEEAGKKC
jgi:hypothetical protein